MGPNKALASTSPRHDNHTARRHLQDALDFETDPLDLEHELQTPGSPIVVDARSTESLQAGHVPGVISMPYRTIDAETTRELEESRRIVVYCTGIGCNAAKKAAIRLVEVGFMVQELDGGITQWKRQGHEVA